MNLIPQSYEILTKPSQHDHDAVLQYLERIGRVCYKSEDKITSDSAVTFVKMLRERKHWAMLEHYIFSINIPKRFFNEISGFLVLNPKFNFIAIAAYTYKGKIEYMLSTSATALNYLVETRPCPEAMLQVHAFMHSLYPEIITEPAIELPVLDSNEREDLYLVNDKLSEHLPTIDADPLSSARFNWVSVKFVTNRQISHELVRHRPASFAQESTRYVNYDNGELTFIEPFKNDQEYIDLFTAQMRSVEETYLDMIAMKCIPQEAAQVLPNATKTEIVVTARMDEWIHIFNMRADKAAHPQMKALMYPLLRDFYIKWQYHFFDQVGRIKEGKDNGWIKAE